MLEISQDEFLHLTTYMKTNYGINLTKKKTLVEGRLSNLIAEKGFDNFSDYLNAVFADRTGDEIAILINRLTTNHTFFMREAKHFEYVQSTVLPYFANTLQNRDLRVWSAGCSSGEEPYTLEIILHEFFGNRIGLWDTKLLATDISTRVLNIAKEGVYPVSSLTDVPPMWKLNYFDKLDGERVRVKDVIRNDVIFRPFNLMEREFPFRGKFHIIFCRNVMIYFDQQTKTDLINRFYDALDVGGYLFIGHSETVDRESTKFKYIMPAVYRKV